MSAARGRPLKALLPVLLALLVATALGAQSRPLEPPPPPDSADFAALIDWLVAHSGHSAFSSEIDRLIDMSQHVDHLVAIGDRLLPVIGDSGLLATTAKRLGGVAMTVRDYERAAELFDTAYIASGGADFESLFAQAQALLQTGNVAAAEQRARTVVARTTDYELKRRAYALVARALHLTDRDTEAAQLLATLSQLDEPELVEPDTLLLQSAVVDRLGDDDLDPISQLGRLHPDSVAMRLVQGRLVHQAPLPSTLLAHTAPWQRTESAREGREESGEARTTNGSAEARESVARVTAIQVGSFADAENATHLAVDLESIGLDATTEEVDRDGHTLHLVLVRVPEGDPREAARALEALRDAGYEGFLIY
ncbi:MAG: SPOR domain-containing protein [Spirochaetales bacterium]